MIFASRSFSLLYTYSNIHFVTLVYIYLLSNQKLGNLWLMYVSSRQGYFFVVVIKDKKYICSNLHAHFKCFKTWINILVICNIFLCIDLTKYMWSGNAYIYILLSYCGLVIPDTKPTLQIYLTVCKNIIKQTYTHIYMWQCFGLMTKLFLFTMTGD